MTPILTDFFFFFHLVITTYHSSDFQLYENNPSLEIQGENVCLMNYRMLAETNRMAVFE